VVHVKCMQMRVKCVAVRAGYVQMRASPCRCMQKFIYGAYKGTWLVNFFAYTLRVPALSGPVDI